MSPALTLVLVAAAAYLAAHLAFDWLARRFLIVSGAEYLLLGLLLGPQVSGILSERVVDSFAPVTTLAVGWIGAIIGTRFFLPELVRVPGLLYRVAFTQSLLTIAVVAGVEALVISWLLGVPLELAIVPALALGAIAAASTPFGVEVVAKHLGTRTPMLQQLEVATSIDSFAAIVVSGLLLCIAHPIPLGAPRAPTPTEWAVITVALGVVGGALFHLFLGYERKIDRLVIALGGALILVSGAAAYLRLSPILAGMLFGAMLANTSRSRNEIGQALERGERPFYFVLLVFGGAAWAPSGRPWWLVPVLLFLLARTTAKIGSAGLAARLNGNVDAVGVQWGRGLLGQGGLALAVAVNYLPGPETLLPNILFTAAIASILLTDLLSARFIKAVVTAPMETELEMAGTEPRSDNPSLADPPKR